jgi:hypothetical protein
MQIGVLSITWGIVDTKGRSSADCTSRKKRGNNATHIKEEAEQDCHAHPGRDAADCHA